MSYKTDHPEQDPAEGSREVIDRELQRQKDQESAESTDKLSPNSSQSDKATRPTHRPM